MIPRLCLITDRSRGTGGRALETVVLGAVRGGVDLVILRERDASGSQLGESVDAILPIRREGVRLAISRRLDVARSWDLDGVHLAADAVSVAEARTWLGSAALIGYSAHSAKDGRDAAEAGASYVTLSPIYPTDSKPGAPGRGASWLAGAIREIPIPVLALGGLTPERTAEVMRAGAWGVATVSGIGAAPDVERAARDFRLAVGGGQR